MVPSDRRRRYPAEAVVIRSGMRKVSFLTLMHPLVRKGAMEAPGVALTGFGRQTPIGSLMAHMVFGLVTGAIYAAAIL
jgi:hypothetical protein